MYQASEPGILNAQWKRLTLPTKQRPPMTPADALTEDEARDCAHGQLARSCYVCELEAEIKRLLIP